MRATLQHGPTDQLPRGYVVHPGRDKHEVRSEPGLPPGAYNPDPNEFYTRHKHRP